MTDAFVFMAVFVVCYGLGRLIGLWLLKWRRK